VSRAAETDSDLMDKPASLALTETASNVLLHPTPATNATSPYLFSTDTALNHALKEWPTEMESVLTAMIIIAYIAILKELTNVLIVNTDIYLTT
jgi:hypothetical protein